jgi:hypothetical protein
MGQKDIGQKEAKKAVQAELSNEHGILLGRADDMEKHNKEKRKMKNLKNEGLETIETKVRSIKGWRMLFALVLLLASAILAPHPAEAARPCPAPGGGYAGALNMLHDPTMLTRPQAAPNGIDGMYDAVDNSSCTP